MTTTAKAEGFSFVDVDVVLGGRHIHGIHICTIIIVIFYDFIRAHLREQWER